MSDSPTVAIGPRQNVMAGEYRYAVTVTYAGESPARVTFQSSVYGAPIVMMSEGMPAGVFVSESVLARCGRQLTPAWIRAFFAGGA